jgi:NAD-dependent DNA ligase
MNAKENDPEIYQYLNGIAFTLVAPNYGGKRDQLELLARLGFEVPYHEMIDRSSMTESILERMIEQYRKHSDYELDGIVIDTHDSTEPKTFKFKKSQSNQTVVTHVEWNVSKDGYLKPIVHFVPLQIAGATIGKATGFNAGFIRDNGIGKGAEVVVSRSGDVIPYIETVIKSVEPELPKEEEFGKLQWTDTLVDLVLVNDVDNKEVIIQKLTDTISKLGIEGLKEGNLKHFVDQGVTDFYSLLEAIYEDIALSYSILGKNLYKVQESIENKLSNITWYELAGSLNLFGRGVAQRKVRALYTHFKGDVSKFYDINNILQVEGFDTKTAKKIVENIDEIVDLIEKMQDKGYVKLIEFKQAGENDLFGKNIVFTGFRSKDLERRIVEMGGNVKTSVSSKTSIVVTASESNTSTKVKKAKELGIPVMTKQEFIAKYF